MENPDTLILNLTFLGTVGMAFLMFLVLFLLGVITLVLAGLGRLTVVTLMALLGRRSHRENLPLLRFGGPASETSDDGTAGGTAAPVEAGASEGTTSKPSRPPRDWRAALKPANLRSALRTAVVHHPALTAARREPPVLAEDWASAVAEADARAMARARAAAPEIKLSVRDLPDPGVPADKVVEVAPLVESKLHDHRHAHVPRSFKKAQVPQPLSPLDTGSLVSLSGPVQALKGKAANGKQPLP
ncbi:conserved hypothetical protein [Arthrobacter sp. 9AX]|uniref:hypothetical protein n=1 Tax=Arthrobacter sp. 9AX TaxID=2653131 RepID=UPI0012F16110|nr:hypothetical protein [Arthrobacter sp. 9AX]VXA93916.1 conserved hypothetical protein [Arthrobacter sp. 9AX]